METRVLCKNISLQEQSVGIIGCSGNRFILFVRKDIYFLLSANLRKIKENVMCSCQNYFKEKLRGAKPGRDK